MGGSAVRCDSEVSAVPEQDPSAGQTFRAKSCSFMQSGVLHPEEIGMKKRSPSSVFFTSSNQMLIKKLRHLHCPLVAGCSIPHKPLPLCLSGCTKFKKLKTDVPKDGSCHFC